MVTSQEIDEKKMGYRGSKSILTSNIVKEQRVDGSYIGTTRQLGRRQRKINIYVIDN